MNTEELALRLAKLRPGAEWSVPTKDAVTMADVEWLSPGAKPSQDEVEAAARGLATWEKIKAERDRRTLAGGYSVAGKWFHSDQFSRTQQLGLLMLGLNIPQGLQWKTMDGTFIPMTPQLAQQVFAAAAASDIAVFAAAEAHRAALQAAPNPDAYDFSEGWPPAFGDEA